MKPITAHDREGSPSEGRAGAGDDDRPELTSSFLTMTRDCTRTEVDSVLCVGIDWEVLGRLVIMRCPTIVVQFD
jgi:hypothetical protein